jgi:hypothetical protein
MIEKAKFDQALEDAEKTFRDGEVEIDALYKRMGDDAFYEDACSGIGEPTASIGIDNKQFAKTLQVLCKVSNGKCSVTGVTKRSSREKGFPVKLNLGSSLGDIEPSGCTAPQRDAFDTFFRSLGFGNYNIDLADID